MAKFDLFVLEICDLKPTFVIISETHLKPDISDSLICIDGYRLFRHDRSGGKGWGGVAIYVAEYLDGMPVQVRCDNSFTTDDVEALWLHVQFGNLKLLLVGVYRQSHYTLEINDICLFEALEKAASQGNVLIMGDFNLPDIKWPLAKVEGYNALHQRFVDMFVASNMYQLVTEITRKRNDQESTIDLILCNDETLCTHVEYRPNIGKSDHLVMIATIQCVHYNVLTPVRKAPRKNFNKADYKAINEDLKDLDFSNQLGDIDGMWDAFVCAMKKSIEQHVPLYHLTRKGCRCKPWITDELIKLADTKQKLWKFYLLERSDDSYKRYRKMNNSLTAKVRHARMKYEDKIVNNGPKAFYGHIRRQLNSKVSVPGFLRDSSNTIVTNERDVAAIFASQFQTAFVKEPHTPMPNIKSARINNSLKDILFTSLDISKTFKTFKGSSSPGPDNIPVSILQNCEEVNNLMASIMTVSFETGMLPTAWRQSNVTPVYKKGDKLSASNYRPISLTCIACKAMEKIIAKQISEFMARESVILRSQHAFTMRRSTITNMLVCVDKWTHAWDGGEPFDIVYLDYEKAFDRVPIERLLHKLEHFGIRGKLLVWLRGFLCNRTFTVRVGDEYSDLHDVLSGIPQGSVLGPPLFNIFLTDLAKEVDSYISLFADDTKIMGNPLTAYSTIQADLDRVVQWTREWLLTLNTQKCTVLHIGPKNPKYPYFLDNCSVQSVKNQKDLGIAITENLKWESQVLGITKRANALLYLIRKAFLFIDKDLFLRLYKVYVRPLLEYGYQIWSPYFRKDIEILERVQRRATKLVTPIKFKSYEDRLEELGLTTLEQRRQRGDLIETYKILTDQYDVPELKLMFSMNHNINLRGHSLKLCRTLAKKNPRQHFLSNRVVNSWNELPEEVVSASTVNIFKNRLDEHFKSLKL